MVSEHWDSVSQSTLCQWISTVLHNVLINQQYATNTALTLPFRYRGLTPTLGVYLFTEVIHLLLILCIGITVLFRVHLPVT